MSITVDKYSVFGQLGSFWSEQLKDRSETDKARELSHVINYSGLNGLLFNMAAQLEGKPDVLRENGNVPLTKDHVLSIGADVQNKLVEELQTSDGQYLVFTRLPSSYNLGLDSHVSLYTEGDAELVIKNDLASVVVYPSPDNAGELVVPASLQREQYIVTLDNPNLKILVVKKENGDELISGVDFESDYGLLVTRTNPLELFDAGRIVYRVASERLRSINSYTMRLDRVLGVPEFIATYYRESQSIKSFERAIAQAAGLTMVREDCTVLRVIPLVSGGAIYCTDKSILHVPYYHDKLIVGEDLEKGENIGNLIRIFHNPGISGDWVHKVDWEDGIDMTQASRFDLTIPHQPVVVRAASETGDDLHCQIYLHGDEEDRELYWDFIKRAETWTNRFINDVTELASVGNTTSINPIDFFGEYIFQRKAILVDMRTQHAGDYYHQAALEFIDREKPVGILTLIKLNDSIESAPISETNFVDYGSQ